MSAQLPGLEHLSPIRTTHFTRAQLLLTRTVQRNDIALLSGEAGCGKTYAIEQFLSSSSMKGRQHTVLEMPPRPAPKEVIARTLKAVTGTAPNSRTPSYNLTEDLAQLLNGSGRVLVIDEAHNFRVEGLQQLRYLHQRGEFSWSLILAGATLHATIEKIPELATRAEGLAIFHRLQDAELIAALQSWDPLLAATSPAQLRYVDNAFAHGNLRRWAKFLRAALDLAPKLNATQLTDKLVSAVLTLLGADAWRASS